MTGLQIIVPREGDLPACAKCYADAYAQPPWNETCAEPDVIRYLAAYLSSESRCCFAAAVGGQIVGVALALIVPSLDGPYLRIEDFCIDPACQRRGYGTAFLSSLNAEAKKLGCDCILLGTQREFPAYAFYLRNGFSEIPSALLYREVL